VFATTAIFSLFAYIWLYICLSDDIIDQTEAFITFGLFFLLCVLAFGADKYNEFREKSKMSEEDIENKNI